MSNSLMATAAEDNRSVCSDTQSFADGDVDAPDDFDFIFTLEEVGATSGILAGLTTEQELHRRQLCSLLLQEMGVRMNVNQTVINVAVLLMHRVFMFFPANEEDAFLVAAACFSIACKTEDSQRKLQYIVDIFYRLMSGRRLLQPNSSSGLDNKAVRTCYESLVNHYLNCEALVLTVTGFDVNTDLPHGHLIRTCRELKLSSHINQTSYFLCTQLLHVTTLCLRFSAKSLAFACIQLALTWASEKDPRQSDRDQRPWFSQLDARIHVHHVEEIMAEFTHVWKSVALKHKRHILSLNKDITQKMQQQKVEMERRLNATSLRPATSTAGAVTDIDAVVVAPTSVSHSAVQSLRNEEREDGELSDYGSRVSTPGSTGGVDNAKLSLHAYYQKRKPDGQPEQTATVAEPPNARFSQQHRASSGTGDHSSMKRLHSDVTSAQKRPRPDQQHSSIVYGHHSHHMSSQQQQQQHHSSQLKHYGGGLVRQVSHQHRSSSNGRPSSQYSSSNRQQIQQQHTSHTSQAQRSTALGSGYNRRPTPQVGINPPQLPPPLPPPR